MDLYHLTIYEVDRLRNAEIRRILSCQPRGLIVAIDTRHDIGVIWISSLSSFYCAGNAPYVIGFL